jgi:flavin-dependent dehydrogenase
LRDFDPIVFDRRRFPGKKCTGIISRETFERLKLPKEFVDAEFKEIVMIYRNKEIRFRVDVLRLNREKLEREISREVKYFSSANARLISEKEVEVNGEKYEGAVIRATGWDGKGRRVKAIERVHEPIDSDVITVYFHDENVGGFSWVVPLPDKTLVGALGYDEVERFIPRLDTRVVEVHGGTIPRCKPRNIPGLAIGDVLCTVKTFTGGGIFGISRLIEPIKKSLEGDERPYFEELKRLRKEISRQYRLVRLAELAWRTSLNLGFSLLNGKTVNVREEFDFHSLLFGRALH